MTTPGTPVVEQPWPTLDTPVAHFFFTSDLESRKDPYLALRSWISQIVSRHDNAFELVPQRRELNLEPTVTRATRADVITVFTQLLHTIPGCIFVADGLDECTYLDNNNTSVMKFLYNVTNAVVGTNARVLFVNRDELEIRHALIEDGPRSFPEHKIMRDNVRCDTVVFSRDIVNRKLPNTTDNVRSTLRIMQLKEWEKKRAFALMR
ncbi:ankyrin repeat domain-containing protein [Fusarium mexicanum]|uniref:Ankyrin repeat domain-containing protein n=1 Tax=Fusarium mexicanum TaxID=751941 RepID=A0A8H5I7L3_9HYPO|nr:ankyrin repeat domain-containing protein [Fusarium mexicanum]